MKSVTSEFSFVLKPAEHGVGVFATEDIAQGTHLRLFGDNETIDMRSMLRPKNSVPEVFRSYCMEQADGLVCPVDFGQMHVGWYLNHSATPNANPDSDYKWYAARDILAGEEITIDYNTLHEPEDGVEDFYKMLA